MSVQACGKDLRLSLVPSPRGFASMGDPTSPTSPFSPGFMFGRLDTFDREGGPMSKGERFQLMQLRSVLDQLGARPDAAWQRLLQGGSVADETATEIEVALPLGGDCEAQFLESVEQIAESLGSEESFVLFHKCFGWTSPEEYFASFGEVQVVMCDVDHNDSDDRLAIVLLAYQMASANACRRAARDKGECLPGVDNLRCTLQLDIRSYQTVGGLSIWRTLRLAGVLNNEPARRGLTVQVVVSDSLLALQLVADYLELDIGDAEESCGFSLDDRAVGAAHAFSTIAANLQGSWQPGDLGTIWLLSGACSSQAQDIEVVREKGVRLNVIEQAQPAWQSFRVTNHDGPMPDWEFPPPDIELDDHALGRSLRMC